MQLIVKLIGDMTIMIRGAQLHALQNKLVGAIYLDVEDMFPYTFLYTCSLSNSFNFLLWSELPSS